MHKVRKNALRGVKKIEFLVDAKSLQYFSGDLGAFSGKNLAYPKTLIIASEFVELESRLWLEFYYLMA